MITSAGERLLGLDAMPTGRPARSALCGPWRLVKDQWGNGLVWTRPFTNWDGRRFWWALWLRTPTSFEYIDLFVGIAA